MSHSCDERYAVYAETLVKARKEHRCAACCEAVQPGHYYMRVGTVFDGSASTVKRCLRCQKIHEHLREKCAAVGWDMWPDERLNCGMDYVEEWGELPEEIGNLAFVSGGDLQP